MILVRVAEIHHMVVVVVVVDYMATLVLSVKSFWEVEVRAVEVLILLVQDKQVEQEEELSWLWQMIFPQVLSLHQMAVRVLMPQAVKLVLEEEDQVEVFSSIPQPALL